MKSGDTKKRCTYLKMHIYSLYSVRANTSQANTVHTQRKQRVEECGAVTSVVFLEGGILCFQLGNVQAKLNLGEWRDSQRLHCLNKKQTLVKF